MRSMMSEGVLLVRVLNLSLVPRCVVCVVCIVSVQVGRWVYQFH